MQNRIKILFLLCCLLTLAGTAQHIVRQIVVVNEGTFNYTTGKQVNPVTLGIYLPGSKRYLTIDTIKGSRFASHAIVDAGRIFVAADNSILQYDADSYRLVNKVTIKGVRQLACWHGQLLVTRGEKGGLPGYFTALDKADLHTLYSLDTLSGPPHSAEKMVVVQDSVYIAVNNGFGDGHYTGFVEVVNLKTRRRVRRIFLPGNATNPENLVLSGHRLFSVNNYDFSKASISVLDIGGNSDTTTPIAGNAFSVASCLLQDHAGKYILFQLASDSCLRRFDIATLQLAAPLTIDRRVSSLAADPVGNNIYACMTDFSTFGKIAVYSADGTFLDSFPAGISPGSLAFDIR